jgi:hypothetical protein
VRPREPTGHKGRRTLSGNLPLIVGLPINGVAYAAIFIIVGLVIYRFAGQFAWRSFLVLFLSIADLRAPALTIIDNGCREAYIGG